jgi:hypothetical protein
MKYLKSFNTIEEYESMKDTLPLNSVAIINDYNGFILNPDPDAISVVSVANLKTINGESIVGTGDITINTGLVKEFNADFNSDFAI